MLVVAFPIAHQPGAAVELTAIQLDNQPGRFVEHVGGAMAQRRLAHPRGQAMGDFNVPVVAPFQSAPDAPSRLPNSLEEERSLRLALSVVKGDSQPVDGDLAGDDRVSDQGKQFVSPQIARQVENRLGHPGSGKRAHSLAVPSDEAPPWGRLYLGTAVDRDLVGLWH